MDPLSVTANLLAILAATGQTIKGLEALYSLRNAPTEILGLMNEVTDYRVVINAIHETVRICPGTTASEQQARETIVRLLGNSKNLLQELDCLIQYDLLRNEERDEQGRPKIARYAWLRARPRICRLHKSLMISRQNLALALTSLTSMQLSIQNATALAIQHITCTGTNIHTIQSQPDGYETQALGVALSSATDIDDTDTSTQVPTEQDLPNATTVSSTVLGVQTTSSSLPSDILCVTVTTSSNQCKRTCCCQCHTSGHVSSPRWLRYIVGSFFCSYTGHPVLGRPPCDIPTCRRSGAASGHFRYYFPAWWGLRSLVCQFSHNDLNGKGASWTVKMPRRVTCWEPVWNHVQYGTLLQVQELFRTNQASPFDCEQDNKSVLHFAIEGRRPDVCKLLIRAGADRYIEDNFGNSPAVYAWDRIMRPKTTSEERELASKLEELFCDEDDDRYEVLHFTAWHQIVFGISTVTLAQVAAMNIKGLDETDIFGRTALIWAAIYQDVNSVRILLELGADCYVKDYLGKTALHWAVITGNSQIVDILLQAGSPAREKEIYGRTPLHESAKCSTDSRTIMQLLIKYGADIEVRDTGGRTPFHLASYSGQPHSLSNLVELGADVEARTTAHETAILKAVSFNRMDQVQALLERNVNLNIFRWLGGGVLHIAASSASTGIMQLLAKSSGLKYVDANARDDDGRTARDVFNELREMKFHGPRPSLDEERPAFEAMLEAAGDGTAT